MASGGPLVGDGEAAFLAIATSANSTDAYVHVLRRGAGAFDASYLDRAADRLAGAVGRPAAPTPAGAHGPMVERAVVAMAREIFKRELTPTEIRKMMATLDVLRGRPAWPERTLEDRQACYQTMIAEVAALEAKGKGCHAVGIVVAHYADRGNPLEYDSISRQLRKLRKKADRSVSDHQNADIVALPIK